MARTDSGSNAYSNSSSWSQSNSMNQSVTQSRGQTQSQSRSTSQSTTRRFLDADMLNAVLAGLSGQMSDAEIEAYARSLLTPQLNAALEASRQEYETARLSREQEIENLASELTRSIGEAKGAYRQSMADVETAALSRGMGRSSYTMQTLANQGEALADSIRALTEDSSRRQEQIRRQITQSAEQNAERQGRLNADFAANLAAKQQELRSERDKNRNSSYLTALSATMGSQTTQSGQQTGMQQTTGTNLSTSSGSSNTFGGSAGSSNTSGWSVSSEDGGASRSASSGRTSSRTSSGTSGAKTAAQPSAAAPKKERQFFAAGNIGHRG